MITEDQVKKYLLENDNIDESTITDIQVLEADTCHTVDYNVDGEAKRIVFMKKNK